MRIQMVSRGSGRKSFCLSAPTRTEPPALPASATENPVPKAALRSGIDWLRASAVFAVMCYHGNMAVRGFGIVTGVGWVGVDLFLVLSGFLVTTTWVRQPEWVPYLTRRARRVLPAYWVTLLVGFGFISAAAIHIPGLMTRFFIQLPFYLTYTANLPYVDTGGLLMPPLWSLSMEVQLWLALPCLVLLARWGNRRSPAWTLAGLLTVPVLLRWAVVMAQPEVLGPLAFPLPEVHNYAFGKWIYGFTPTHMDGFLVGLWLALQGENFRVKKPVLLTGLVIGAVALVLSIPGKTYGPRPGWLVLFQFTGLALGFGAALVWVWTRNSQGEAPRFIQWLSARIYSIYLTQAFLMIGLGSILVLAKEGPMAWQFWTVLIFVLVSCFLGDIIHQLVERQFLGDPATAQTKAMEVA